MADYNPILDAETDPEAGLRSSLFKRMVANPIAIAEGAPGAPKVQGIAMDGVLAAAFVDNLATAVAVTGLDRAKSLIINMSGSTSGGVSVRLEFSNDGGSTWGSIQQILSAAYGTNQYFTATMSLDIETGDYVYGGIGVIGSTPSFQSRVATFTVPADCNAIRFSRSNTSLTNFSAHVQVIGGVA